MNTITLHIHSIEKTLFSGVVQKIVAQTRSGEITILPEHIPLITELEALSPDQSAVTIFEREDTPQSFSFNSGFLEVRPESNVVILVNA